MSDVDTGELLRIFVADLPEAVALLDIDGHFLTWNAGAKNLTGYDAAEVLGRHNAFLFTADDIAADKPAWSRRCALAQGVYEETGSRVRKDGSEVRVRSVLIPLYDSSKELTGFGTMVREVTDVFRPITVKPRAVPATVPLRKTILVVDDDKQVRDAVSLQLTSLGYRTLVAVNGPEALDAVAREPDIDLLLTDVVMPGGLHGREVAEQAIRINPHLKVLFTSGYFEGALVRDGKIDDSAQLLVKPYRKNELARKVQEVLSAPAV
jgi:PAS domain S-box-containing protein